MINFDEIINDLNVHIYESLSEKFVDEFPIELSYKSNGNVSYIEFMGIQIWNTEEFMIEGEKEMYSHLVFQINKILTALKTLSFDEYYAKGILYCDTKKVFNCEQRDEVRCSATYYCKYQLTKLNEETFYVGEE